MGVAYVFLADGFEEIEAVTPVDVLRRAGVEVRTVGVTGDVVQGAHGIAMQADLSGEGFHLPEDAAMVVLPGGGRGTENLKQSKMVAEVLARASTRDIYISAICAAPVVLHAAGLLNGKRATAFPSVQAQLTGSRITGDAVEQDGKIITARSAGVALAFAHKLAALLAGQAKADEVVQSLYP